MSDKRGAILVMDTIQGLDYLDGETKVKDLIVLKDGFKVCLDKSYRYVECRIMIEEIKLIEKKENE